MKIQGPNHFNLNFYQKQMQTKQTMQKNTGKEDQLEISKSAKRLQKETESTAREQHLEKIKQAIDAGEYRINAKETAEKMINFWNNSK